MKNGADDFYKLFADSTEKGQEKVKSILSEVTKMANSEQAEQIKKAREQKQEEE